MQKYKLISRLSTKKAVSTRIQSEQLQKIIFDDTNKSTIYKHQDGEENLKWIVRGGVSFTLLNTFLTVSESVNPIFGGWNGLSFGICTAVGLGGLACMQMLSRRTVSEMKLHKTGDFVDIKYYNAFWIPHYQTIHCSEFSELQPSFFGLHRVELTSIGKIWLNMERNTSVNPELGYDLMTTLLGGNPIQIEAHKQKKKNKKY